MITNNLLSFFFFFYLQTDFKKNFQANLCSCCLSPIANIQPIFGIVVCSECRESELKYQLVSATKAHNGITIVYSFVFHDLLNNTDFLINDVELSYLDMEVIGFPG